MSTSSRACPSCPGTNIKPVRGRPICHYSPLTRPVIPLSKVFLSENPSHRCLHATVTSICTDSVTLSRAFPEHGLSSPVVRYDYLIYALGSVLPAPLDLWRTDPASKLPLYHGTKPQGIAWMKQHQEIVKDSQSVVVVGGGALGIQFATDIATIYPEKKVTLLHSRKRLLPRFDEAMHDETMKVLETITNLDVILNERLDLSSLDASTSKACIGARTVRTLPGREIAADLVLMCTGQTPNTRFLADLDPTTVDPATCLARVLRTMQLCRAPPEAAAEAETTEDTTPYPHIFVIGDAVDAFGAIAAGHNAYYQGEVAARNVLRLINRASHEKVPEQVPEPLEQYTPGPPAIKVSLGLDTAVFQSQGVVGRREGGAREDLGAALMWPALGYAVAEGEEWMFE
ncbi:hypothetical protein C0992_010740 [Termitomyces sp. T32_za158]|nr:hypothetical protein C0992_010740 [Termitomyces sp. T32_za158]